MRKINITAFLHVFSNCPINRTTVQYPPFFQFYFYTAFFKFREQYLFISSKKLKGGMFWSSFAATPFNKIVYC